MVTDPKVRYSDEELQEFKTLIDAKLEQAKAELATTEQQISDLNENGFNQQGGDWYDDSTAHTDLEMLQRMLTRQQRYVQDLKNALLRIHNKTYGICSVTGHLIDKNRLRLVPHATKSIDGKNIANAAKTIPVDTGDHQGGGELGLVGEQDQRRGEAVLGPLPRGDPGGPVDRLVDRDPVGQGVADVARGLERLVDLGRRESSILGAAHHLAAAAVVEGREHRRALVDVLQRIAAGDRQAEPRRHRRVTRSAVAGATIGRVGGAAAGGEERGRNEGQDIDLPHGRSIPEWSRLQTIVQRPRDPLPRSPAIE